jgi:hypothetical protein
MSVQPTSAAIAWLYGPSQRLRTPLPIYVLRNKTPKQVHDDVSGFALRYVNDWEAWLSAGTELRPELFGRIVRKWQATRPRAMRRLRDEAQHDAPFLNDLLARSAKNVRVL